MSDTILKIVKSGASVWGNEFSDILMHSDYSMFKYHMDTTQTMTINAGDSDKTVSFAHGLSYVPAFIAYMGDGTNITSMPRRDIVGLSGIDRSWFTYADATNIYIKWRSLIPFNQSIYYADQIYHEFDAGSVNILVGNAGGNSYSSAVRFPGINVTKNQTITSASIRWTHQVSGSTDSNTKFQTFGIDEDNVGNVDTSKTTTTAVTVQEQSKVTGFFNFDTNVKSQVEEITTRSGWVNGNNIGFMIFNTTSPNDAYIGGDSSSNATLNILVPGSTTYSFRIIVFKDKIA